jgi:hypothetical protein
LQSFNYMQYFFYKNGSKQRSIVSVYGPGFILSLKLVSKDDICNLHRISQGLVIVIGAVATLSLPACRKSRDPR